MEDHNTSECGKAMDKLSEYDSQTGKSLDDLGKVLGQKDDDISGNIWREEEKQGEQKGK